MQPEILHYPLVQQHCEFFEFAKHMDLQAVRRQRNKYQVSVLEAPYKQLYLKLPSSEGIFEKFSNIILKQENIYR